MAPKYGAFERMPTRYTEKPQEAWVYLGNPSNTWSKFDYAEIGMGATPMSRRDFEKRFGELPPLPPHAFKRA